MSGLRDLAGAEPGLPEEQIPADTASAQHCSDIHEDQIMCNWGRKPMDCIPSMYRPLESLSSGFTQTLSEISLIAPGKKGLAAARKLFVSAFDNRCYGQESYSFEPIQEDDLRNALINIHHMLAAVGDINKARLQNNKFLRSHGFQSNDPFDWTYDTVMALCALVKLTGGSSSKIGDAARFLELHYLSRIGLERSKFITKDDVQRAIVYFQSYSNASSSSLERDATVVNQEEIGSGAPQGSGLCTTGSVFNPCLPPLDVLLSIAKAFYNARKQRGAAYGIGDGPTIMSQEVATKGIYNDNRDAKGLGTFLKHDSRNYSYKNLRSNEEAIVALEKRFGEPFCEIFSCPDIQADQALRTTQGILSKLHEIAEQHHINTSQTLRAVISQYFKRCLGDGKPHVLTAAGLQQLATELAKASIPDDDGAVYKGWTSLGGSDAPITPIAQPAQQSRRRIRMSSLTGFSLQPDAKKSKAGLTSAGRVAYVSTLIPGPGTFPDASSLRSAGSASRRVSTMTQTDITESAGNRTGVAGHIAEPNDAATPTPAPRAGRPQPNIATEASNPLVKPKERLQPGVNADDDNHAAADTSASQNVPVHVGQDTSAEDIVEDTTMTDISDINAGKEIATQQLSSEVNSDYNGAQAYVDNFKTDLERDTADMTELRLLLKKANDRMETISDRGLHLRIQGLGEKYIQSEADAESTVAYANDTADVCDKMKVEIATAMADNVDLMAENVDLKRQLEKSKEMVESTRNAIQNENSDLKQQLQNAKEKAMEELSAVQAEKEVLKRKLQQAEEKAKSASGDREALQARHDALEEQFQRATNEANSACIRAYEFEQELSKKSKEQEELAGKLEDLSKSLRG